MIGLRLEADGVCACYVQSLKLFPAIVIVPTMQISWTLFSILSGMVYFKEYTSFGVLNACMFVIGVMVRLYNPMLF